MSKTILALGGSLLLLGAMIWLLRSDGQNARHAAASGDHHSRANNSGASASELMLFCAASNRAVMEAVRKDYEEATGKSVAIQYGPSQTLLSQLEVAKVGDLYLPADDSFLSLAKAKGLISEIFPLATMQVGLVVPKGNPKQIGQLEDLFLDDVRVVQANPDATAVGKVTREIGQKMGFWKELEKCTRAYRTTVNDVASDVQLGSADVGIVYDAVVHSNPELEFINLPEFAAAVSTVSLGVVSTCKQPTEALHFSRFAAARDRGLIQYRKHGFRPFSGDAWVDVPELTLFAGSMLRPAIEKTIVAFEAREGVKVSRVYNGCGILVSQMKSGLHPDAYFACDLEFMSQVEDLFPQSITVSSNQLAILVPKGNPRKIRSLNDLTQTDLRLGIGHEEQCAMGWITQRTLIESGLKDEIMANVTTQTPTGDMLVNQLQTGSLDAAIAYVSNATGAADAVDVVRLSGLMSSTATQPWGIAEESQHPQLAARLFEKICSQESQQKFKMEGFNWQLNSKPH